MSVHISPLCSDASKVYQLYRRSLGHVVLRRATTPRCYLAAHTEPHRVRCTLGLLVSEYQLSVVDQELEDYALDLDLGEGTRV